MVAAVEWEPIEVIALQVASADLHYVSSAVAIPKISIAAESALMQYGAMVAYETQLHFGKTVGWTIDAGWDQETATAARMAGKFFADRKRNLEGVVRHFEELLAANHGAFFPPDRRGKLFDLLRDDLSVVTLTGLPYMTSISGHYLLGLQATEVAELGAAGPVLYRLGLGIGRVAGQVLSGTGIEKHQPPPARLFSWWDAKARRALPRLFGGQLPLALTASLMTIHSIVVSAAHAAERVQCGWCELAARKHRFVASFQALTALRILRNTDDNLMPTTVVSLLDGDDGRWLLEQGQLRNALVHLGMQDIRGRIHEGDGVDSAIRAYTGLDAADVEGRTHRLLRTLVEVLTGWMLTPPADGKTFQNALQPVPMA